MTNIPTSGTTVRFIRENSLTNAAAAIAENGAYPEATWDLVEMDANVRKYAVLGRVTDEFFQDYDATRDYINNRLAYYHTPGIHTEAQVEGWKLVTRAVHGLNGRIFLQLWHVGRQSHNDLQPGGALPVAPSAIAGVGQSYVAPGVVKDYPVPRPLETSEVGEIVGEFRRGAELAKHAGFDGVELHAANGYLFEQFLSDSANHRTDKYGGGLANRARFLIEVTEAVASVWPASRIGVRLSPANTYGGITHSDRFGTYSYVVRELNRFGLAYLHFVEPLVAGNMDLKQFEDSLSSRHFKPLITGDTKLISAGGQNLRTGSVAVASSEADAIAYGRLFISNPNLPLRFAVWGGSYLRRRSGDVN